MLVLMSSTKGRWWCVAVVDGRRGVGGWKVCCSGGQQVCDDGRWQWCKGWWMAWVWVVVDGMGIGSEWQECRWMAGV